MGVVIVAAVGGAFFFMQGASQEPVLPLTFEDKLYHSAQYGMSFSYPDGYQLFERDEQTPERTMHSVILISDEYVNLESMEGPPAITVTVFENMENTSLEDWIKGNSFSNYKLSSQETLTPVSVAGEPALSYEYSGLYETDAVALLHDGRVYLFTAGWLGMTDQIRQDFKQILDSVIFVSS